MKNFINTELYLRVNGFDKNDDGTFQIQNISLKNDKLVKHTVKVHKDIPIENLSKLVGKVVKIEDVEEYKKGFKTFFAGKDIKIVDKDLDFYLNKEIELKVDGVSETEKDTVLQSIVRNGTRCDLFNIKIKGQKNLKDLQGKKVKVTNVNVIKMDAGTFYNTDKRPQIIN